MVAACKSIYGLGTPAPRITIVIAAKRHHMRFYQEENQQNPAPGTVVDRGVTSQLLWEFYLQAHRPLAGTARPTHYVVVVDNIFNKLNDNLLGTRTKSDILYSITQALSYCVGRATTATSVLRTGLLGR
ncbi:Ribonuclease H-like domain containing protein [Rhypophila sp. PSN 637]